MRKPKHNELKYYCFQFLFCVMLLSTLGCKRKNQITTVDPGSPIANVYLSGGKNGNAIWRKDDSVFTLTDNNNDVHCNAYDIAVHETDVYATGTFRTSFAPPNDIAAYWKNGVPTYLSDGTFDAEAFSIFVSGADVYVCGYELNQDTIMVAKYWKNGIATSLSNGSYDAFAAEIFVDGNDVYVAGSESAGGQKMAKYWKNGISYNLTDGSNYAYAISINVINGDVYVGGAALENNLIAKCWKNGIPMNISDTTKNAHPYTMCTNGSEIYMVGFEYVGSDYVAAMWHKGVHTYLSEIGHDAEATSVKLYNNDLYVLTTENIGMIQISKLWKNGVPLSYPTNETYRSVFLK